MMRRTHQCWPRGLAMLTTDRQWYGTSCDTWHWIIQTALLTRNRLRKLQEWNIGVWLVFFRYTHHAMDVTMEWGQKMLQGQLPAHKAARSTKIRNCTWRSNIWNIMISSNPLEPVVPGITILHAICLFRV